MSEPDPIPRADLARVANAQARLMATIVGLDDEDARRPSLLPGWSVGHVLTHLARNADSHIRRAEAAKSGEVVEQYAGGEEGRAEEIERGALRRAGEIVEDVGRSGRELQACWESIPAEAWVRTTRDVEGRERPLNALPGRRWQEVEVHMVDLGLGPTHREWSDDFVASALPRQRASLGSRVDAPVALPADLDERDELAWLYGRLSRPDLPHLGSWG
jgi:maleylpyruvate isomerase